MVYKHQNAMENILTIEKEIFALQLKHAAMLYHQIFMMNISPIHGRVDFKYEDNLEDTSLYVCKDSFKHPHLRDIDNSYDSYTSFRCKYNLDDHSWSESTGLGVILGYNNIWALDIDEVSDISTIDNLIDKCLELLHLPKDYEWVVYSGSGKGFHILFRAQTIDDNRFKNKVIEFCEPEHPQNRWLDPIFKKMELRMKEFLVLPPSRHLSGGVYKFRKDSFPNKGPMIVSIDSLYQLLIHYFKYDSCHHVHRYDIDCRCYLRSESIYTTYGRGSYGGYEYDILDEIAILESCCSANAINSLACIYAEKGCEDEDIKLIQKAKELFEKSGSSLAIDNLKRLIASGIIQENCNWHVIDKLGEYKYQFIKNQHRYKYLIFDTETTGLGSEARLVQLSWICADDNGNELINEDSIIIPIGFSIPEAASKVHRISTWRACREGRPVQDVLFDFMAAVDQADILVGHNIDFDLKIIESECKRYNDEYHCWDSEKCENIDLMNWHHYDPYEDEQHYIPYTGDDLCEMLKRKTKICTMKQSVNCCKIPSGSRYKYPTLTELHTFLFDKSFENAHDAMEDVRATLRCFIELYRRGFIEDPKV